MDNFIFAPQKRIDDGDLIALYEGNGLFAKIIDTPAEEATRALANIAREQVHGRFRC